MVEQNAEDGILYIKNAIDLVFEQSIHIYAAIKIYGIKSGNIHEGSFYLYNTA